MTNIRQIEKIKISNNLWITFRGNKFVFGTSDNKEFHHTISLGNNSGFFDLHITNQKSNEHTTILRWEHKNVLEILPQLIRKIFHSIFELSEFDFEKYGESIFLLNNKDYDLYKDFHLLIKKNQIRINNEDPIFQDVVQKLSKEVNFEKIKIKDLLEKDDFISIIEHQNEHFCIIKNQFLDKVYKIDSVYLEADKILKKIFGDEVYYEVLTRIENAVNK